MTRALVIDAAVHATARPAMIAMAEQLCEALGASGGEPWTAQLRLRTAITALGVDGAAHIAIASMAPEVEGDESLAAVEARWREGVDALMRRGPPSSFLATVFRVAPRGSAVIARIRRLNRLACEISHDTNIGVIDLDNVLAHFGARTLQADWRLDSRRAAETAAHAMVTGLLANGLDHIVPQDVQTAAAKFHGGIRDIAVRVGQRLARVAP